MRRVVALLMLFAVTMLPVSPARGADPRKYRVTFTKIETGLSMPVGIAAPKDGSKRLFVVEQAGRIRVRNGSGVLLGTPYLDIRSKVECCGERGLLGLAFHPNYKSNGLFFVHYTLNGGDIRIVRYRASPPSANTVNINTGVLLMTIEHSQFGNHNGGQLQFGPDGYLYIGIGDGGGQGDPSGNAQNRTVRLGKILRWDVNNYCSGHYFCVPATNPYKTSSSFRHDIWHYGLRNPWRFSFDAVNGHQWIADVGGNIAEEINHLGKAVGGKNFGWDCREGFSNPGVGGSYCSGRTFTNPLKVYGHSSGRCAIIGGYVYRGPDTRLQGIYLFADYCTGEVWGLGHSGSWITALMRDHSQSITSFGESESRALYVVDTGGNLYRIGAANR